QIRIPARRLRAQQHHPIGEAEARAQLDRVGATDPLLPRAGTDAQGSVAMPPTLDPVLRAEGLRLRDRVGDRERVPQSFCLTEQTDQGVQVPPRRGEEDYVATARAAAHDGPLEHHDPERRLALTEPNGGPEPRESAADDADIRDDVRVERWARLSLIVGERLLQPEAPGGPRSRHVDPHEPSPKSRAPTVAEITRPSPTKIEAKTSATAMNVTMS